MSNRLDLEQYISTHIKIKETVCPCNNCCYYKLSEKIAYVFEELRQLVNLYRIEHGGHPGPLYISNGGGVRCIDFQIDLQHKYNYISQYKMHVIDSELNHKVGHALDILKPHDMPLHVFFHIVSKIGEMDSALGIGYYPWGIHIDDGYEAPEKRRWGKYHE